MRGERGSADFGLLSAILTTIAALLPPAAFLSPGVKETLGDIGLIVSMILGVIAVARLLVLAGRAYAHVQQIPAIAADVRDTRDRVSSLEQGLGVTPPAQS